MLLTCTLLLPLLAPQQVRLNLEDGGRSGGEAVSLGLEEVVYVNSSGDEVTRPSREILSLVPGPMPAELAAAEAFAANLDFQNAANAFDAASGSLEPAWLAAYAGLRHAEVLLAWSAIDPSQASAAASAFKAWSTANADSYWLPRASYGQAKAQALSGDVQSATTLMQELADRAFEKNLGRQVEFMAALTRSEAFLLGGQAEVAEARLRDLEDKLGEAKRDQDIPRGTRAAIALMQVDAQLLLGRAIEEKDGITAAASYWEGLAEARDTPPDVRAAARIGLALAAKEQGDLRTAQLQLARVVALQQAKAEVMAHALYEMAEVTEALGNKPVPAKTYRERLKALYPETSWAAKLN
jgi:hypothetical protein